jgi:abortive infection bacteriophage resistance protein
MNSIAALRNCCAHHARIWNRNYPVTPDLPKRLRNAWIKDTNTPFNKLYAQLCCMTYWYNAIDPQNTFTADIKALLLKYPIVDSAAMGFVKNWQDEPLWKKCYDVE